MTLEYALCCLARVHTADDEKVGFNVRMGAMPGPYDCRPGEYIEAWKTVREYAHLRVEPGQYPAGS